MDTIKIKDHPIPIRHYKDRNGKTVLPGCKLLFSDGCIEEVYLIEGYTTEYTDLGINASNPEYLKRHPYAEQQFYSLHQFSNQGYIIIEEAK